MPGPTALGIYKSALNFAPSAWGLVRMALTRRAPVLSRRALLGAGLGLLAAGWPGSRPAVAGARFSRGAFGPLPPEGPPARPATYALQEALARGQAGLAARLDPAEAGRPYFELNLAGDVPQLVHDCWDYVDIAGRMVDALGLAEEVVGPGTAAEAQAQVLAYLRARQGAEGLFWNGPSARWEGYASDCVESFSQSRAALGLVTWLQRTGAAAAEDALDALVDGLSAVAVWDGDAAYFPGSQWRGDWLEATLTAAGAPDGRAKYGWGLLVTLPLVHYYALTQRPPAGRLVDALLRFFIERSALVGADGQFAGLVHAEGYAAIAAAAARYAALVGREDWLTWATRVFAWIRAHSTRYGWVPDRLGLGPAYYRFWYGRETLPPTCETCGLVDALELAITLAEQGHPAYWDDVERWTRNHLLASQLGAPASFAAASPAAADALPAALRAAEAQEGPLAPVVAGAFDSASLPGGLLGFRASGLRAVVEGCCACSGLRGLFLAWHHAVIAEGGTVWVHLGLSRDSPWAEVVSYEPYAGQLDVRLRAAHRLCVRVPSWVPRAALTVLVDEQPMAPSWEGAYLRFESLARGQTVSLRYPLVERTEEEGVEGERLTVRWRGGTVVSVEPCAPGLATYARRHVAGPAPWIAPPDYPRYSRVDW